MGRIFNKGTLCVGLLGLVGLFFAAPHLDRDTYRTTVTEKQIKRVDKDNDRYLVFTESDKGDTRVFENVDSPFELKWNSSDVQAQLKAGQTYDISTYGWRVPFLSMYENIVEVKPVNQD